MNISQFAIENKRFSLFVIITLLIVGVYSYFTHPSLEDPRILIREALITTSLPGLAPERVERLITRKIEEKIKEIPEVKEVRSTSEIGLSTVMVVVKDKYFDLAQIWQKLRNKMNDVKTELPKDAIGPFVNDEFGDVYVATLAITSDDDNLEKLRQIAEKVRDELYLLKGVGKIELHGVQKEQIYIEVNNAKIARYKITPLQLLESLQKQNILPQGYPIEAYGRRIIVAPTGSFKSVQEIKNLVVKVPQVKGVVSLGDVVNIQRGYIDPQDKPVYYNGIPTVALAVALSEGESTVTFGSRLKAKIREITSRLPPNYQIHFATFQPKLVEESVWSLTVNFYQALFIVALVIIFLLGWREGIIVGSLIPLTVLVTLLIMRGMGVELQRVSIASLVIALGLLVDNGIVVAEDIRSRFDYSGQSRLQCIIATYKELALPLFVSTLTTILAFVPILLSTHIAGEYTRSLSQVIAIALLASWFLAFFAIPLFCYLLFKKTAKASQKPIEKETPWTRFYQKNLYVALRYQFLCLLFVVIAMIAAGILFYFIPKQFFPESLRQQFVINIDLPIETTSRKTSQLTQEISKYLNNKEINPEITQDLAFVGYGGVRFYVPLTPFYPASNRAFIVVDLTEKADVDQMMLRVENYLRQHFPEVRARLSKLWLGSVETGLVRVRLMGPSAAVLTAYGEKITNYMRDIPGMRYVYDDWEKPSLKVMIKVDQARAREAGITSEDISRSLAAYYQGIQVSGLYQTDQIVPIVVRLEKSERFNLDRLYTASLYSTETNKNVPLIQIASIVPTYEYSHIQRYQLQRAITISAKNVEFGADYAVQKLLPFMRQLNLPQGYTWKFDGEVEASNEAQHSLFLYLPLCVLVIFALLLWQFNSYRKTIVILFCIPLAFIGAVVGLEVTGATFSFMAILGVLSLAGIIVNNGIVLIDRIRTEIEEGQSHYQAVINASVRRFNPILVTTLTTILGLIPLHFFGGPLWFPLTSVIIFGLAIGTIITLIVIPVFYSVLFRVRPK